jgi:monofunctional glycosyltransferase
MKKKNGFLKKASRFILKLAIAFFALSIFSVILFRWVPIPFTPLMIIRLVEQASEGKELKLQKDWQPIDKISPHLPLAVVASEDQRFLKHYGFEFNAMKRAMEHNKKGKRIRGGSTISQQTAKNVFLWHGRNYLRKGLEVYFTALIELFWNKERILEVYLNVIEMGDGIYGAQAASKAYFGKDAENLAIHQAATIAAILPNPRKYSAIKPGPYVQKRQLGIQVQMRNLGGKLDFEQKNEEVKSDSKRSKKKSAK